MGATETIELHPCGCHVIGRYMCLPHKLAAWRLEGVPMSVPMRHSSKHNGDFTQRELHRATVDKARAEGVDIQKAR